MEKIDIEKRLTIDIHYMSIAFITSFLSKACRAKVGAVIVKDGIICSSGYNGTPRYTDNCCEFRDKSGTHTKETVIHAELNAILNMVISNSGTPINNSTIYITYAPCIKCASMIKQVGIKRVVYTIPYRDTSGILFLQNNGVEVSQIDISLVRNSINKILI